MDIMDRMYEDGHVPPSEAELLDNHVQAFELKQAFIALANKMATLTGAIPELIYAEENINEALHEAFTAGNDGWTSMPQSERWLQHDLKRHKENSDD